MIIKMTPAWHLGPGVLTVIYQLVHPTRGSSEYVRELSGGPISE